MRYLMAVALLFLLLLPVLVLAGQKAEYLLDCEYISGGQCKKTCSEEETRVRQVEIMAGEKQGSIADVYCGKDDKELKCCVYKGKITK